MRHQEVGRRRGEDRTATAKTPARIGEHETTSLVNDAEEQLTRLRGAQYGKTADAAQQLLGNLGHAATLIEQAVRETAAAALTAGMALEDLARWARLPADVLAEALPDHRNEQPGRGR
ncbi:hypothetical protein ACFU7X_34970 [Streptomyces chartreusis]|uniref:hypothetical protein n=1 Tax=Streptomyces chartreusis TaxID=1969 RepID=UPI00368C3660